MSTLYISEYVDQLVLDGRAVGVPVEPPIAEQTVTISGTSAQSSAFNAKTRYIRIEPDVICSRLVGADPTATTSNARMAADSFEFIAVKGGHKIAVITNT
jgi:hypothetical protein